LVILLVVFVFGRGLFTGGSSGGQDVVLDQPADQPLPQRTISSQTAATATPAPTRAATGSQSAGQSTGSTPGQKWTILLYQDADDQILEKDLFVDLNEAEKVGSTDRVNIVAQIDRYRGGFDGDGNWTNTRRYHITRDDDLTRLSSEVVADLGEANMSDGATLVDFVTWGMQNYPADKYVLILSDHGMGWPGGWSDPTSTGDANSRSIPLASRLGDQLYLNELDGALSQIQSQAGLDKFELIGLDACLMSHVEVYAALAPYARYAVASQETEPSLGWAYTSFLGALVDNPDMDGAELSRQIVNSYIVDDQRIIDDQARADLIGRGQPLGGLFGLLGGAAAEPSAQEVADEMVQNVTLTALDLSAMPEVMSALNDLAYNLQSVNQRGVAQARNYAQSYTSIFGEQVPPSYIDIGNFVQLLKEAGASGALGQAGDRLLAALKQAIVAEIHGPKKPGSTGVSVYFPVSQLYGSPVAGPPSYDAIAQRFAENSLWDDLLLFHYTGQQFQPSATTVAIPDRSATVTGPGAGAIQLSPVKASASSVAPGDTILLSTHIQGQNVGYVYLFAGFYDQAANSINVTDMDYLEPSETREVSGVYYPVWPEDGSFNLEFEWEPIVPAIQDGTKTEVALFQPTTYGATFEQATYIVSGIYKYADGEQRSAQLYFRNGALHQIFGFTNENRTGAPREIIPQSGDTFTIQEQWMDLGQNGAVTAMTTEEGATLTFGNQTFTWQDLDAAAGEYVVGFIVEDLDGNRTQSYTRVTVQ
jgi:hypothetical protein